MLLNICFSYSAEPYLNANIPSLFSKNYFQQSRLLLFRPSLHHFNVKILWKRKTFLNYEIYLIFPGEKKCILTEVGAGRSRPQTTAPAPAPEGQKVAAPAAPEPPAAPAPQHWKEGWFLIKNVKNICTISMRFVQLKRYENADNTINVSLN